MEDRQIIALYFARKDEAIAETEKKYGRYLRYIARNILASEEDAEEAVSDTYFKIWNTIPPNEPPHLKPYAGMLCRQRSLDAYEANHAKKRSGEVSLILDELRESFPDEKDGRDIGDHIALRDALNAFVRALPKKKRTLFIRRYWYASSIAELAEEFGMKESAIAVLMHRTRKKLKIYLEKEGFTV